MDMDLKVGKTPVKDEIHPEFLRNLGPKTHLWIAEVFHAIYKSGRVPKSWKTANVIALLKPGKAADNPTSYRPISLLSVLSKLMERIILRRISPLIEPEIPPYQAGFWPNPGCCNRVLSLTSHLEKGFNDKLKSGAAFIGLYDTVWKKGLFGKKDCLEKRTVVENS
ncbi:Reverse transcriptase domain [Cinara cedri]|uniref:Reverse transcriptase domain n=1 Tax=Cinara cedri TaxID=506608 RepID=A0A5E4MPF2_9HEMI|nr:Reverse transcriptase domain [Cinara cedri]